MKKTVLLTYITTASFLIALALPVTSVFSQGNLHLGPVEIHPSISEKFTFDDNIYRESNKTKFNFDDGGGLISTEFNNKIPDWYNEVSPRLLLELPLNGRLLYGKINKLKLDYRSEISNYLQNADLNEVDHFFIGGVTFEILKGFEIVLEEDFSHTDSPGTSERDNQHPRDTNTAAVALNLQDFLSRFFNRVDVELKWETFFQDYSLKRGGEAGENEEKADRREDRYSLKLSYHLTPKLIVYPKYTYGKTKYDKSSLDDGTSRGDSHYNKIVAGFEWQATARTTGTLEIGAKIRDYNDRESPNVGTIIADAGISIDFIKEITLGLNLNREQFESEFTGGSNSYIANTANLTAARDFGENISVDLFGVYTKSRYNYITIDPR